MKHHTHANSTEPSLRCLRSSLPPRTSNDSMMNWYKLEYHGQAFWEQSALGHPTTYACVSTNDQDAMRSAVCHWEVLKSRDARQVLNRTQAASGELQLKHQRLARGEACAASRLQIPVAGAARRCGLQLHVHATSISDGASSLKEASTTGPTRNTLGQLDEAILDEHVSMLAVNRTLEFMSFSAPKKIFRPRQAA